MAMLQRDTDDYERVCNMLGIYATSFVSIPKNIVDLPVEVIDRLSHELVGLPAKQASALLCAFREHREMAVDTHRQPRDALCRAFFITGRTEMHISSVWAPGVNRCVRFYGGRCMQLVSHFHYVAVFEFACKASDILTPSPCSVQGVATSTTACIKYIDAQAEGVLRNEYVPGYVDADWYSPDGPTYGARSTRGSPAATSSPCSTGRRRRSASRARSASTRTARS